MILPVFLSLTILPKFDCNNTIHILVFLNVARKVNFTINFTYNLTEKVTYISAKFILGEHNYSAETSAHQISGKMCEPVF